MATATVKPPPGTPWRNALAPWALPVALLLAWQLAAQWGWLSSRILPEPWSTWTCS